MRMNIKELWKHLYSVPSDLSHVELSSYLNWRHAIPKVNLDMTLAMYVVFTIAVSQRRLVENVSRARDS